MPRRACEIVVALSVLVVAASIFCQTLLSTSRIRQLNQESALAADAARVVLERMRNQPFLHVYRNHNEDPTDDPGGLGTGAGHLFDVPGLTPLEDAPSGKAGRIWLPSKQVQVTSGGSGSMKGGVGSSTTDAWQLHEDVQDESLGLPRDLNGDNVVDALDHSKDYLILPVRVRIDWKGGTGARQFEIVTQLGDFPRVEAP
jgi:hypothetical protein